MSGILKPGDEPMSANGTIAIHVYSPSAPASLMNSHFPDVPDSWFPITECQDVVGNSGVVLEIAGALRVDGGDSSTMVSIVNVSIGGMR